MFGLAPVVMLALTFTNPASYFSKHVSGMGWPILAVELTIFVVAVREGFRPKPRMSVSWLSVIALVVIAWATVFLVAPAPAAGIMMTARWMIHLAFGLSAGFLISRHWLSGEEVIAAFLSGFMLSALILIVFAAATDRTNADWHGNLPGFINIRGIGYYAAAAIVLSLGSVARKQIHGLLVCACGFALIFWTGSRGAILASVAAPAFGALFFPQLRRWSLWAMFFGAEVLGLVFSIPLDSVMPIPGADRIVTDRGGMWFGNGRIELWMQVLDLIEERPFFGYGEGQLKALLPVIYPQPHNVFLQVALAWGVVGSAFLALAAAGPAFRSFANRSEASMPFFCTAIMLAGYALIDGTLFHTQPVSVFALCLAFAAADRTKGWSDAALPGQHDRIARQRPFPRG